MVNFGQQAAGVPERRKLGLDAGMRAARFANERDAIADIAGAP